MTPVLDSPGSDNYTLDYLYDGVGRFSQIEQTAANAENILVYLFWNSVDQLAVLS